MSQDNKPSLEQRIEMLESTVDRLETAMQCFTIVQNSEHDNLFTISVGGEDVRARFTEKMGGQHYRFEYVDSVGFCIIGIEGVKENDRERLAGL